MSDKQTWMQRLDEFREYLQSEGSVGESAQIQYPSFAKRWIDFCLPRGHDPATFDQLLLDQLLDQGNVNETSRRNYASYLRRWTRWASDETSEVTRDGEIGDVRPIGVDGWFEQLEGYIDWRRSVGGHDGQGIAPPTAKGIRSSVRAWIRHALEAELDPSDPAENALQAFLASKNISDKSRKWRAGHVRRWWRRWPEYQRHLEEETYVWESFDRSLVVLVLAYRADGYPTEDDLEHMAARERFAQVLMTLDSLGYEDREQVKSTWTRTRYDYGGAGQVPGLHRTINDCSPDEWESIRSSIHNLCYGEGDLASRFDACISHISGLGELVATRLLALSQPERFIPNFILRSAPDSSWPGKLDMIELLVRIDVLSDDELETALTLLDEPDSYPQQGALVIKANDFLVDVLGSHFSDDDYSIDAWGMAQFLYWLAERYANDDPESDDDGDEPDPTRKRLAIAVEEAARDLLCDVKFLNEIVDLLKDKGQVILYGPPGTGKTYFAQRLAKALSPGAGARTLVQFHPAYSYEDFFEGFRPAVDEDGNMTYQLTPGPLMKIAEIARGNPHQRHVMVIDEINRANLPRVLGELLFLLEYRDRAISTQYGPERRFSLPENLWFIGTMNTADRSIALIDAAMRRRFHFVPFFPNRPPTQGLLRSWTQKRAPSQAPIADLLDRVNGELEQALGGDHLLIGPSHFMKRNLDAEGLRRIWVYNIEPLIEDQLFGQQEVISRFRFDAVWKRHGPAATSSGAEPEVTDEPAGDAVQPSNEGVHVEGQDGA